MLKIHIPPQHSIDDPALWIARGDCWDQVRIDAEKELLADASEHPVERWYSGATRWSLHPDALLTVPEALRTEAHPAEAVPITEYLTGKPTTFEIRLLPAVQWREALSVPRHLAWIELVRRGLVQISGVDDGRGGTKSIEPERGKDGLITMAWIDAFDVATGRALISDLGAAILELGQSGGGSAEGKR